MFGKIKNKWDCIPVTVKVSLAYTICSILQKCISFITLPLFTRLLTTEQYGQYTIYSSWSGILTIFLTLNLAYGSFSTAMTKYEDQRDEYISSIQGICLLLSGIFLMIYLPWQKVWNRLFELPTSMMVLMVFETLCATAVTLWSGKKRFEFKYKSVVLVTLLIAVLGPISAFALVMHVQEKGYARIVGYVVVTLVVGGIIFIVNCVRGKKLFSDRFWKYAFGFNIPLLAYYLSQVVFNQSDRIMISHLCGTDKAAMYGVAYNLAMILTFVLNAINNSYVPWFYGKIKEGRQEENKPIACGIALIMALLLLVVIWFAPEIIIVLAGTQYEEAIGVVLPVSVSLLLLFYTQLFANVEFYYEDKISLVLASVGSAAINCILNFLLIPRWGFVAAGYTTLVSYLLFALCNYLAMKKLLKRRRIKEDGFDIKKLLLIFVVFLAGSFVGMFLYDYRIIRIIVVLIIFITLLHYKEKLMSYIKILKK